MDGLETWKGTEVTVIGFFFFTDAHVVIYSEELTLLNS